MMAAVGPAAAAARQATWLQHYTTVGKDGVGERGGAGEKRGRRRIKREGYGGRGGSVCVCVCTRLVVSKREIEGERSEIKKERERGGGGYREARHAQS